MNKSRIGFGKRVLQVVSLWAGWHGLAGFAAPQVFIENQTYDFGVVYRDRQRQASHTFVVQNIGDEPLLIEKINPSCGCTRAEISSSTIPPGETADLFAELTFKHQTGREKIRVTLYTNDPESRAIEVGMQGELINHWTLFPNPLDLGTLGLNTESVRQVILKSQTLEGDPPGVILNSLCENPAVTLIRTATETLAKPGFVETHSTFEVRVKTDSRVIRQTLTDLVFSTNQKGSEVLVLPLSWGTEGDLKVEPKTLSLVRNRFSRQERGSGAVDRFGSLPQSRGMITVSSKSGLPFRTLEVDAPPLYSVTWVAASTAPVQRVQVELTGDTPGHFDELLHIRTDRAGEENLEVRLIADVDAPQPYFSSSASVQSFGTVFADEVPRFTQEYEIQNGGSLDLELFLDPPEHGQARLEASRLASGERTRLILDFELEGLSGPVETHVRVRSNDPSNPEKVFRLSGRILSRWEFDPPLLDYKSVEPEQEAKRRLRMKRRMHAWDQPTEVASWTDPTGILHLAPGEMQFACDQLGYCTAETEVVATLRPGREAGLHEHTLDLAGWAEFSFPPPPLKVAWETLGDLSARPSRLVVGTLKAPAVRTVRLYSRGKTPFAVTQVQAPDGVQVEKEQSDQGEARYKVTLPLQAKSAPLVFVTDRKDQPSIEVPIEVGELP